MPLTVLAPCSLSRWAAKPAERMPRLPALEALLDRATLEISEVPLERTLATAIGLADADPLADVPVAPLRLAADGRESEARGGWWLAADPIVTSLWTDNAAVAGAPDDLTAADAAALVAKLDRTFAQDALSFVAPTPLHWYVRCASRPALRTTPLWRALGAPMREALPAGADGARWRARLNEAQMLLHGDATNARREATGRARVDSVWWWGGGTWPRWQRSLVERVLGGPPWVAIACAENRIAHAPAPDADGGWANAGESRNVVVVADDDWERPMADEERLAQWDARIFAPLCAALASHKTAEATLVFAWRDGTLRARCAAPARSALARIGRWLGMPSAHDARALGDTLAALDR